MGFGYVLALKKSHCWWHVEGTIGALWQAAEAAGWRGTEEPGEWTKVVRTFWDGNREDWWALEVETGPYGRDRTQRAFVGTTESGGLPEFGHLVPAHPRLGASQGGCSGPASVVEVVRLYGLRMWVEQSYKQVKHALVSATTRSGATWP